MSEVYSTSDLWLSALFLCETDAELIDMQVTRNGRETIMFCFKGENLSRLARSYCKDEALANVTRLRARINDLRDVIFQQRQHRY